MSKHKRIFMMKFLRLFTRGWTFPLDWHRQTVPHQQTFAWPQIGAGTCLSSAHSNHQSAARFSRHWHLSRWETWIIETQRGSEWETTWKGWAHNTSITFPVAMECVRVCLCLSVWCKSNTAVRPTSRHNRITSDLFVRICLRSGSYWIVCTVSDSSCLLCNII